MPSLSPKENYLRAPRHEETEYVPILDFSSPGSEAALCGILSPTDWGQGSADGVDGYGVRWVTSDAALGGLIPEPGNFLLKDITRWKNQVTIPDVSKYDWNKLAETEYAMFKIDREKQVLHFFANCGVWERLAALMSFEEAMIAVIEEPEVVYELMNAITDHKIRLAEIAAKLYRADVFINLDDIATAKNLFMFPDTFRSMIKPHWKRLHNAVKDLGMIPLQHICGHAELCIEDYIEAGAEGWNPIQPSNDIAALLDKYGDKFMFQGGYDTTGKPGRPDASVEEVKAEVERCFREYGKKKGYVFMGGGLPSKGYEDHAKTLQEAIRETANCLRFAK
jgi:hypothetical protein